MTEDSMLPLDKRTQAREGRRKRRKKSITKVADELFSKIVRSEGSCRRCGTDRDLQCAHVVSRRYRVIRWDRENAMPLCRSCHTWQTHRPLEGDIFFREVLGDQTFENLRLRALAGGKVDMDSLVERLRRDLRGLEDEL